MINSLRKKMIWICGTSVVIVFLAIYACIYVFSIRQLNDTMDMLTDRIYEGGGRFLPFDKQNPRPPAMNRYPDFFTEETPFSTRFFVIWYDRDGGIVEENIDFFSSITSEQAQAFAEEVMFGEHAHGWKEQFRYKVYENTLGKVVVFVDGSMNRSATVVVLLISGAVMICSMLFILVLIIVLSKRVVKPIAENYEKQRQFITDANHELKTPLTLIMTNLEIVEAELGHSEWLDDIRGEGERMSSLVNQLTELSRLDEEQPAVMMTSFSLSDMIKDMCSEFETLVFNRGFYLETQIWDGITYTGDEGSLRHVLSILLDNAVKYSDPGGTIWVSLTCKRFPVITVENMYRNVDQIKLNRLFDRFYREDKARTASGSFGIGLSLAKSIVQRHKGEISAYKAGEGKIGFQIILK